MLELIQTPAIVQSIRTLVDGGCKLDIVTNELNPTEMASLFGLKNKMGWMLFKEDAIQGKEVEDLGDSKMESFDKKSPSQRMHDRMFVCYKATHSETSGFRQWYERELDRLGSQYLDKAK